MIHHSCDCCKRLIEPEEDLRYIVRMEVYAAAEGSDESQDDDRDSLAELQDMLQRAGDCDDEDESLGEDVYRQFRFDLCPECVKRVLKQPLPREAASHLNFSEN